MVKAAQTLLLLLTLMLAASCSHRKTITREELRTQLTSAASFAAEAETLIGYIRQNRSTRHYAEGHVEYLADEVSRSAKELHEAVPGEGTEPSLREARAQVDCLIRELAAIPPAFERLAAAQERVATIRKALEEAKSSL